MKHVFVETNFLIDLARPLANRKAEALLDHQNKGIIALYVPWCSVSEAKRTLIRIIAEDLDFSDKLMSFAVKSYLADRTKFDIGELQKLIKLAGIAKKEALRNKETRIDDLAAQMTVIRPSQAVVDKTLHLFDTKSLKPFDEMALGAILTRAAELYAEGERELYFCTLDKKDLGPGKDSPLQAAYDDCGLVFRSDFTL